MFAKWVQTWQDWMLDSIPAGGQGTFSQRAIWAGGWTPQLWFLFEFSPTMIVLEENSYRQPGSGARGILGEGRAVASEATSFSGRCLAALPLSTTSAASERLAEA